MARHILVLGCLAALPALAQYSGSSFNVQPSGGAVGQVCFYETVANGSNKICLKAPASASGDADIDVSTIVNYWSRSGATLDTATAGDAVRIGGHLLFTSPSASNIGDATNYAQTLYGENIDAAPSGVTGNYLKGRKLEVADDAGGTSFWDIQSKANGTNSTLYVRDAAGANVIDFHRIDATAAVDYANVYVDLYPDSGGSQKLGKSGQQWGQVWGTDTYTNYLHAITGTVVGLYTDLVPITNNTYDLGASAARVKKLWVVDIDCSGTCPGGGNYWSRTGTVLSTTTAGDDVEVDGLLTLGNHLSFAAPSASDIGDATNYFQTAYGENANFAPSGVTANYTKIRKLEVVDDAGGTSFWDLQSKANATNSTLYLRDAAGGLVVDFHRIDSTAAVDYANFYVDLYPDSGGSQKLGKSGQQWGQVWATDAYHNYLHQISGSYIYSYAHVAPIANATYDLGDDSTPLRWRNFAFTGSLIQGGTTRLDGSGNLTVTSCTGCGSGSLPVVDTTGLAKGSSDATKIARLEVDGLTTGTTRVMTVPNYDFTIAATNVNNNFSTAQSFAGGASIDIAGGGNFSSLAIGGTTRIDSGGNGNLASLQIGGSAVINSSREWVNFNFVPSVDNSLSLGTTSKRWFEGYFSSAVKAYTGGVARGELATGGLTIRSSGGSTLATIESSGGQANLGSILIGGNSFVDASRNVTVNSVTWPGSAATVNSSGNALFGTIGGSTITASSTLTFGSSSALVQGSTTRIDTSGRGVFVNGNITGGLVGTPSAGYTFYVNGSQVRVRFSDGTDKEVSLL